MARWTKLVLIGLAVGCIALALVLLPFKLPRIGSSAAAAQGWNSQAVQSTLAGVRVKELDTGHAAVIFYYDVDNRTDTDYRLASGPDVVIMGRLQPNGSLSTDQQVSLDSSAFVPSKNQTRIGIEVSHPFAWPTQKDAAAERQLRQLVADQVAGLQGFVLFDQANRYQIEFGTTSPESQVPPVSTSQN